LDLTPGEKEEWQELLHHRQSTTPPQFGDSLVGEKRDVSQRLKSCGVGSRKLESLRQRMKAHSYGQSGQDPRKLFQHFDRDNTGELGFEEFKAAVRKVGRMTIKQITDKVCAAGSTSAFESMRYSSALSPL
jgi:Ca2+-binding EF-hand superfamily protein